MARSKKAQAAIDDALSISQAQSSVGLGVDLVEVDRMERILARTPSFKAKVFSEGERVYCDRQKRPAMHYAARFAAKEAVVKALGCGFTDGVSVRDVEVRRSPYAHRRHRLCHGIECRCCEEAGGEGLGC